MKKNIFKTRMKKIRDPDLNKWELTEDENGNATASYIGRGNTMVIPPLINGKEYTILTLIKDYDGRDISVVVNKNILIEGMLNGYNVVAATINCEDIPTKCFYECKTLEKLKIGRRVTNLSSFIFWGCTGLKKIEWGAKNISNPNNCKYFYTFSSAGKNTEGIDVVIGDDVENIPDYLFYSPNRNSPKTVFTTPNIKTITMTDKVKSVGKFAFSNCGQIEEVNFKNPDFVGVGRMAFTANDYVKCKVTKLTFPENPNPDVLCQIQLAAFQNAHFTNELVLPNNLKYIGDYAFDHCNMCSNVTTNIPSSVEVIGGIGSTVYSIFSYAGDDKLYTHMYEITDDNTFIGDHTFYDFSKSCNEAFTVGDDGTNESQYFKAIDGVLYGKNRWGVNGIYRLVAYPRAKRDEVYQIEEGVIALDALGFGRNTYCKELILPDSYVIRGYENFVAADGDRDGYPDNFNEGNRYFNSLTIFVYKFNKLERFNVKSTNTKYKAVDGCIYSIDGKSLWAVPHYHGGTIAIEEGTEKLEHGSLHNIDMSIVSGLSIPASVNNIPQTVLHILNNEGNGFIGKMTIDENNPYYMIDEATGKIVSKTS